MSDFINDLNDRLEEFNAELLNDCSTDHPLIFVNGLPRSGTTLLMQYLAASFSVLYINNLIARFWKAPLVGLKLSKESKLKTSDFEFNSDFGRTSDPLGPHEFSYFWKEWLQIPEDQAYDPEELDERIDWDALRKLIMNMQVEANAPLLLKALHPARHMEKIRQHFGNVIVIHIERNPREVCRSLKKARINRMGDAESWWSLVTKDYADIKDLPYSQQIPRQMKSLALEYESNYKFLEPENLIRVDFDSFLENPDSVRQFLSLRLSEITGKSYDRLNRELPTKFKPLNQNEADDSMDAEVDRLFNS